MLPNSKSVKQTAKSRLSGRWPLAIATVMISLFFILFLLMIFSILSQFFTGGISLAIVSLPMLLIGIVTGFPLWLGTLRLFRYIYEGTDTTLYTVFHYFSTRERLLKSLKLGLLLISRILLVSVLLLLPAVLIDILASGNLPFFKENGMPIWFSNLWVFGAFLRGIASVVLAFIIMRHYLAAYIFVLNDNLDCLEIMLLSKKVSKISMGPMCALLLSFILYFAISVFIVPLIFTLPIIIMSYVVHANTAVDLYNKRLSEKNFFTTNADF